MTYLMMIIKSFKTNTNILLQLHQFSNALKNLVKNNKKNIKEQKQKKKRWVVIIDMIVFLEDKNISYKLLVSVIKFRGFSRYKMKTNWNSRNQKQAEGEKYIVF